MSCSFQRCRECIWVRCCVTKHPLELSIMGTIEIVQESHCGCFITRVDRSSVASVVLAHDVHRTVETLIEVCQSLFLTLDAVDIIPQLG
jgi:hypothetical protein